MIEAPNVQRLLNRPSHLMPADLLKLWRHRPVIFLRDVLDAKPLEWQEEFLNLYVRNPRTIGLASKGVGKTWTLASIVCHFMITGHMPKVACLSITKDHLMANLWAEILKMRANSPLLSRSLLEGYDKIRLVGKEGFSFIDARSFPKQADENTMNSALAGHHADWVMFAIDESGKIPDGVIETADAALSTGDAPDDSKRARLVTMANPEEPRGIVYRAYKGLIKHTKWEVYQINGDPDNPKRSPLVSIDWARQQIEEKGRDNAEVKINILGEYPTSSSSMLLSDDEIYAAMHRDIKDAQVSASQLRLGIDVARGGVDNTVFALRRGLKAYPLDCVPSDVMGPTLAGKAALMVEEKGVERIFVDNTGGYGGSVIDSLQLFPNIDVTPVVYNAKAQDKRYRNKRTEMWVRMRDWIRKGGQLPNDPRLAEELQMPRLIFHEGAWGLEAKDQIKARLGRSPDRADALAQTFADIDQPTSQIKNGVLMGDAAKDLPPWEIMEMYRKANEPNHISDPSYIDNYSNRAPNHRS